MCYTTHTSVFLLEKIARKFICSTNNKYDYTVRITERYYNFIHNTKNELICLHLLKVNTTEIFRSKHIK